MRRRVRGERRRTTNPGGEADGAGVWALTLNEQQTRCRGYVKSGRESPSMGAQARASYVPRNFVSPTRDRVLFIIFNKPHFLLAPRFDRVLRGRIITLFSFSPIKRAALFAP